MESLNVKQPQNLADVVENLLSVVSWKHLEINIETSFCFLWLKYYQGSLP